MAFIDGTAGNDSLVGTNEEDYIYGYTGNDTINPLLGANDVVNGEEGTDLLILDYSSNTYTGGGLYAAGMRFDYNYWDSTGDWTGWASAYRDSLGNEDSVYFENIEKFRVTGTSGWDVATLDFSSTTLGGTIDSSAQTVAYGNVTLRGFEEFNLSLGSGDDYVVLPGFASEKFDLGAGNDTINPGRGEYDYIEGGEGTDLLILEYSSNPSPAAEDALPGIFFGYYSKDSAADDDSGFSDGIDFFDFEKVRVTATSGWDIAHLDFRNDTFGGTFDNSAQNVVYGGVTLRGFEEFEVVYLGSGDDNVLLPGNASELFNLGAGNDTINPGQGEYDDLDGGEGTDLLILDYSSIPFPETETHIEGLYFEASGGEGVGSGGGVGGVVFFHEFENFRITGTSVDDSIEGGDNGDTLAGSGGDDSIDGAGGNDSLNGGNGADTLIGGLGNDTFVVGNSSDVVVESASQGTDLVRSTTAYTLGANVENLELLGSAGLKGSGNSLANRITGTSGNDTLNGAAGDDSLSGGAGNDSLHGSSGVDTLVGGTGNDTYGVDGAGDVVVEAASAGTDLVRSSVAYTLGANVENLELLGSTGLKGSGNTLANVISGTSGNDTLNGLSGNDSLIGGVGNDSLYGSTGADSMAGGAGNDTYGVDGAGDVVVEAAADGVDLVRSTVAYTFGANVENLELLGSTGLKASGNSLANVISGTSGDDTLNGAAGNDSLKGGSGNDSLHGSSGSDTLIGGTGNDTYGVESTKDVVVESSSAGMDWVRSSVAYTLGTNVENLELLGSVGLKGSGNSSANTILGGAGNDTLNGLSGSDSLIGGAGNDSLLGSTGSDTLIGGNVAAFGVGEIDTLSGGSDGDRFVLGVASGRLYDDGSASTKGTGDYALITDFTVGSDILQLKGAAGDYYLGASPVAGVSGSALFFENGTNDELVAIIRSGNSTTLTAANTIQTATFV